MRSLVLLFAGSLTALMPVFGAPHAFATTLPVEDPLHMFAMCAGRLSAQMEFEWLADGPASEKTAVELDAMQDIIEALMPEGSGPTVLSWRINAKAAMSNVLTTSYFAQDAVAKAHAAEVAVELVTECRSLIIS